MASGKASKKSMMIKRTFTSAKWTSWANDESKMIIQKNSTNKYPSGYTCIGYTYANSGSRYIGFYRIAAMGGTDIMGCTNPHAAQSSSAGVTATLKAVFVKNDYVQKDGW